MNISVIFAIILNAILTVFLALGFKLHSRYTETKVLKELSGCVKHKWDVVLHESRTLSLLDCSRLCTGTADCRRVMFNTDTRECTLYLNGENCYTTETVDDKYCYRQNYVCNSQSCSRCPIGYYGYKCQHIAKDCKDALDRELYASNHTLVFTQPSAESRTLELLCASDSGTPFIMYRRSNCMTLNFNRTFVDYSRGFGNLLGNFFIGLEKIHQMVSNHSSVKLLFAMRSTDKPLCTSSYKDFRITNRSENYRLSIGPRVEGPKYCGDFLTNEFEGRPFSTYDRDFTTHSCPVRFASGWWYLDDPVCSRVNIFGKRSTNISESAWHWEDFWENATSFESMWMRLSPVTSR